MPEQQNSGISLQSWDDFNANLAAPSNAIGIVTGQGTVPAARTPIVTQAEPSMVPQTGEAGYFHRNVKPGVPFNPMEGVDTWTRIMGALRSDPEDRYRYLANTYGPENVRPDENGQPIVKLLDPNTGSMREVLFSPHTLTMSDMAAFAVNAIPAAGAAFGGATALRQLPKVGQLKGAVGFLRDAIGAAAGQEGLEFQKQLLTKAIDAPESIDPVEMAAERAAMGGVDVLSDLALGPVGSAAGYIYKGGKYGEWAPGPPKLMQYLQRPISKTGAAAADRLGIETGIRPTQSIGARTGIPFFAKMQHYFYRNPAGASPVLAQKERIDAETRAIHDYMVQPSTLREDHEVGQEAVDILNKWRQSVDQDVKMATKVSKGDISTKIREVGNRIGPTVGSENASMVGSNTRQAIVKARDVAEAEQDRLRNQIATFPEATAKMWDASAIGLKNRAQAIVDQLPSTVKTLIAGVVPQPQAPEVEKSFVESNIVPWLKSMLEDKAYSISDLLAERSRVYRWFSGHEAVARQDAHWVGEIANAFNKTIEDTISKVSDPALRKLYKQANQHYINEVIPFRSSKINDLFRRIDEPGYVENHSVVQRLFNNPDAYERTVRFLGKGSPQHMALKRQIFDQVVDETSTGFGSRIVDGKAFQKRLSQMAEDPIQGRIFQDVFGQQGGRLAALGRFQEMAQGIPGGKIPADQLEGILLGKTKVPQSLKVLANKYAEQQRVYKNGIMSQLVSGKGEISKINPEEFVEKFVDVASKTELAEAWSKILTEDPNLALQIRRKMVDQVWKRAARSVEPSDLMALMGGNMSHLVSGEGLYKALGEQTFQNKLRMIIGDRAMRIFKDLTEYKAAEDWAAKEAGEVGMFAGADAIKGIIKMKPSASGIAKETWDLIRFKMGSIIITSPGFGKWLTSTAKPRDFPEIARAIVTSQAFIKSVIEDSSSYEQAMNILREAKRATGIIPDGETNQQQPQMQAPVGGGALPSYPASR